jgi:hypothetical protein
MTTGTGATVATTTGPLPRDVLKVPPHCHTHSLPHSLTATLSHCHTHCHTVTLSNCYTATLPHSLSHCHTFILSYCSHYHTATLPHYHTVTLPHCHTITLSHCHTATLPHYHTATLPHGHPACMYITDSIFSSLLNHTPYTTCMYMYTCIHVGTIYNDIQLTTTDAQLATSLIIVGAYVGCLLGSTVSEKFGRKKGILWNNVFFILGSLLCGLGNSIEVIFVGRVITGLGFGIETVVVPVLLSEVARPENRGRLTTMHQLQLTLGIMVVGLLSYCFVIYVDHGWRYVQLFYALPCVLMIAMSGYIPESPKYLVAQGRYVWLHRTCLW